MVINLSNRRKKTIPEIKNSIIELSYLLSESLELSSAQIERMHYMGITQDIKKFTVHAKKKPWLRWETILEISPIKCSDYGYSDSPPLEFTEEGWFFQPDEMNTLLLPPPEIIKSVLSAIKDPKNNYKEELQCFLK